MKKSSPTGITTKPTSRHAAGARAPSSGGGLLTYLALGALVVGVLGGLFAWHVLFPTQIDPDALPEVRVNSAPPPSKTAPEGMVWIPGGEFYMGVGENVPPGDTPYDLYQDARAVHPVYVDGFWMDRTEVTNEQFAAFVAATGYQTIAERKPDPKEFPDVPPQDLVPFSLVFRKPAVKIRNVHQAHQANAWWDVSKGASWKNPDGPASDIKGKEKYPAVHIAWDDAVAYCKWAGKRLPTEAEWEFAARGGFDRKEYCWGDDLRSLPTLTSAIDAGAESLAIDNGLFLTPGLVFAIDAEKMEVVSKEAGSLKVRRAMQQTKASPHAAKAKLYLPGEKDQGKMKIGNWMCNAWQGDFPNENLLEDGYEMAAPVASYPPNGYGLHDMAGNVWEWCSDYYLSDWYRKSPKNNPKGPATSYDVNEPGTPKRVQRGGSFLCADNYCRRYLPGARGKGEPTSGLVHVGFRAVKDVEK